MMAWPGWGDSIPVTMPKSTMEMVGISGSITVSRRALMELGMVGFFYAMK
jgi:antitoxin component of MazEF toxin-antitoxin module